MPIYPVKDRLVPYKILSYLLYAPPEAVSWLSHSKLNIVKVMTGDAARAMRMKNAEFWEALYWLKEQKLILGIEKQRKRGSVIIRLESPRNIITERYNIDTEETDA